MKPPTKECLPLDQVLKHVFEVESELIRFYDRAAAQAGDDEAAAEFRTLSQAKRRSVDVVAEVCRNAECGAELLDRPSEHDVHFLSALTRTAFHKQAGDVAELLHPSLTSLQLAENALRLERDLMLFYSKFYSMSCAPQRPVFQELIAKSQGDVMSLVNLQARLRRQ